MAAATQSVPALLTLEEYLSTSYRPDCELVDGQLEERNVGGTKHGLLQMQLGIWFFQHSEWNLRTVGEQRTQIGESTVRLPDVAVVPDDEALLEEPRVTPPFIAIEILSPDDRLPRVIPRLRDFAAMGVPHIWLLDPVDQVGYVFINDGLNLVQGTILRVPDSPVFVDLAELFLSLKTRSSRGL